MNYSAGLKVSIHAPAGGATQELNKLASTFRRFNPRACGRRDKLNAFKEAVQWVSIHAPAGGATCG